MHFLDGHKRSRPSATTLMSPNLPWRVMSRSVWPTVGCDKPRRYFDLFEFLTLISTYQKCPVPRGPCAAKKSPRNASSCFSCVEFKKQPLPKFATLRAETDTKVMLPTRFFRMTDSRYIVLEDYGAGGSATRAPGLRLRVEKQLILDIY